MRPGPFDDWDDAAFDRTMRASSALVVLAICVSVAIAYCTGCGPALIPADDPELQELAGKLARCRAEGRDAGSYEAYEACKKREGAR